jgi:phosphoglycerol transferase MdoB-like AlkP superfamily enzyme
MDKYLGRYIESLQKYSWYNQCTIIITADHKPNGPKLNAIDASLFTSLPLIILRPSFINNNNNPIFQTSVFPSILDMYHLSSKWRGIGKSIFMPDSIQESPFENKRTKYEQMISDYLTNKYYLYKND